ncbi:MAG: tRNA (adenosine(37)-N6)-threonylcarbamoyltransferase complex ATPase subunit type 1 TsaE [Actinomycetota bacterium]
MPRALAVTTASPDETRILGASLAPVLLPGDVISLSGDLGAGKTVFVQGVVAALGVSGRVTSPTFTIVQEYDARYPVVHMDVYRLTSFQEVLDLGFDELLDSGAVLIVEWGDALGPLLPRRYLQVEIRAGDADRDDDRVVTFRPQGDEWWRKLASMRETAEALLDAASPPDAALAPRFTELDGPPGGPVGR